MINKSTRSSQSVMSKSSTLAALVIVLTLLFTNSIPSMAQCEPMTELKNSDKVALSLFFYPSTLRMINLDHNQEFNDLIQDIDQLMFLRLNDQFNFTDFYQLTDQLTNGEQMEEYILVDGPKQKLQIVGRSSPAETIGVVMIDGQSMVFDIEGSLDLSKIPKLYEYISQSDSTFQNKFSGILDIFEISSSRSKSTN